MLCGNPATSTRIPYFVPNIVFSKSGGRIINLFQESIVKTLSYIILEYNYVLFFRNIQPS